jgi:hypothetical protein
VKVSQQDMLARANSPGDRLADRAGPDDDYNGTLAGVIHGGPFSVRVAGA